jgi:hypothetical protein
MRVYQLAGLRVALRGGREAVYAAARNLLAYKSFSPASVDANVHIGLSPEAQPPECAGRLLTPPDGLLHIWQHGDDFQVEHRSVGFRLDVSEGTARAYRMPSASTLSHEEHLDVFVALSMSLYVLAHQLGFYGLHAVGLVAEKRGFLFSGRSDSGKSTTALALVRQGWDYLSDDSLLLHVKENRRVAAIGARRRFCVDPEAAALFPELASHDWPRQLNDPAKWCVDVEMVYGVRARESCEPHVLLFPEISHSDESLLAPIGSADAISRLVLQSAYSLYKHHATAAAHFAALGCLVKQCTHRRLILGRDALTEPERLVRLLLSA